MNKHRYSTHQSLLIQYNGARSSPADQTVYKQKYIVNYDETNISGVNSKPAYCILFRLGRNDEIRKGYLSTGY